MESDSDEALLQRVARGDEEALLELYDRLAPRLFAIARRILEDERKAGEVLRDAFLAVRNQAAGFEFARKPVFSWAVAIVRNRALEVLRANRRHFRPGEPPTGHLLDLESAASNPDLPESRAVTADTVRRALRAMPDEQRRCLEWGFLRGLNHLQLSELFGMPPATVKTSIRRGLLRLQHILEGGNS